MISYADDTIFSCRNKDDAISFAKELGSFEKILVKSKEISIKENGDLLIQNIKFQPTRGGIENICSTLKIPDPFAEYIPTDLFITNVNRLLNKDPEQIFNVFFDKKEQLIDMNNRINFTQIPTLNILERLKFEQMRVMFDNHFTKIELVPDIKKDIKDKVGDLHAAGYTILHYPTSKSITQALYSIWTLVCTNGAILPRELFREKLNLKNVLNVEEILSRFTQKIDENTLDQSKIKISIDRLKEAHFTVGDFKNIFSFAKRLVGSDVVEDVLRKPGEEYLNHKNDDQDFELEIYSKYDTYYNLTDYGSNIIKSGRLSRKFQTRAGKLLINGN